MRRRLWLSNLLRFCVLVAITIAGLAFLSFCAKEPTESSAISATEFKAGRIIDDSIFYNANTMTAKEIDAFIKSHSPACDMWGTKQVGNGVYVNGKLIPATTTRAQEAKMRREKEKRSIYHDPPYVCVSEYYENPTTHKTNFETGGKKEAGMLSAGEIIYKAAQTYKVNPQVLLVMLKKESYAWGDEWPLKWEYNTVMGYACPDTAPCNEEYYGFYNQMMTAAWQLNYYREHINSYSYKPYRNNSILYSPTTSCGRKNVYIENVATTSLYIYTPYTPNDAALRNYPGTASCGSYGNRNFYMYFREWFGNTLGANNTRRAASLDTGEYRIVAKDNTNLALFSSNDTAIFGTRRNNNSDIFIVTKLSNGVYSIKDKDTGKALDVANGDMSDGAIPIFWEYHGGNNQKWRIYANNDSSFSISPFNNQYISLNSVNSPSYAAADPTNRNQSFYFVPVNEPTIASNSLYRIVSARTKRAIDIQGYKNGANSAAISSWTINLGISDNQTFRFNFDSATGYYNIINPYSGLALDLANGSLKDGSTVLAWKHHGISCTQRWNVKRQGNNYAIISSCSDKALDTDLKGNISVWGYHGGANQLWSLAQPKPPTWVNQTKTITSAGSTVKNYTKDILDKSGTFDLVSDDYSGYIFIKSHKTGEFLSTANAQYQNGTKIVLSKKAQGCNSYWKVEPAAGSVGAYTITSACTGLSLDHNFDGNLSLWSYHGGANQKWYLK